MEYKFYARTGLIVTDPSTNRVQGQVVRRVGRDPDLKATKDPVAVQDGDPIAGELKRVCRQGMLYAADKETAEALGVPFVEVEYDGTTGEWVPKSVKKTKGD